MKRNWFLGLAVILGILLVASCSMGIMGSSIPAGTYALTSDNGTWTVILDKGSFDYTQKSSTGTTLIGYRGTFDGLTEIEDDTFVADLTSLEGWTSGDTYSEIALSGQTIKMTYWDDYPLDDVEAKAISFYLDANGDGSYANTGGNVAMLGMNLQ